MHSFRTCQLSRHLLAEKLSGKIKTGLYSLLVCYASQNIYRRTRCVSLNFPGFQGKALYLHTAGSVIGIGRLSHFSQTITTTDRCIGLKFFRNSILITVSHPHCCSSSSRQRRGTKAAQLWDCSDKNWIMRDLLTACQMSFFSSYM